MRKLPLAHIDAQPPAGNSNRDNTTPGTRDGNQRTTTLGQKARNRDNTTLENRGGNAETQGYRVFQTRRMPAGMLQDVKAAAVLLGLSQQDVVLRCVEEALVGLCEADGLAWGRVRELAERM